MKKNPARNTIDTKLGNILARKTNRPTLNEVGNTIGNFIEMLEIEALYSFFFSFIPTDAYIYGDE